MNMVLSTNRAAVLAAFQDGIVIVTCPELKETAVDQHPISTPAQDIPRRRPELPVWAFRVIEAADVKPKLRRVWFTTAGIENFHYKPGQDVVLFLPLENGETGRRHYTIRSIDRDTGRIAIDFVMHGKTPGPNFARNCMPGDVVEAKGPRGRVVFNPDADWHLLTGDETCLPAIFHILETMPEGTRAHVFLEVQGKGDEETITTGAEARTEWLHRGEAHPGPSSIMLDRLARFELPQGRGHAYIIGETSNVRAQRHHLIARGMDRDQIASEGYWRPGRTGGHDHVDD